jgi:hypothetical protein
VVFDSYNASTVTVTRAYQYVLAHRVDANIRVVNMSLGGYGEANNDVTLHSAIAQADQAGILTVCAGGNSNASNTLYPSDYEEVLSVVAVDKTNTRPSFSDHNQYKDLAAPGVNIYSTGYVSDTSYRYSDGTSMASPMVAATAALLFAKDSRLTPDQVKQVLYDSATDLGDSGWDPYYGYGLVNAKAALETLEGPGVPPSPEGDIFTLTSALDKTKCFDIPGASSANGVRVALWPLEQRPNQRFRFVQGSDGYFTIINVKSKLALDISGGIAKDNASVIQYTPTGRDNQKWRLIENNNGTFTVVSKLNEEYCLDLSGNTSANSTPIIVYTKGTNKKNQQFFLNKVTPYIPNGTYKIQSVRSGQLLDIEGGSLSNNARALSWPANGGLNQQFTFTYNALTGYYTIRSVKSKKVLDVSGASAGEGASVIQYTSSGAYNQQWALVEAPNGAYYIYAAHSGKVLDLKGGGVANGTPVIVWSLNGGTNQRWVFTAV